MAPRRQRHLAGGFSPKGQACQRSPPAPQNRTFPGVAVIVTTTRQPLWAMSFPVPRLAELRGNYLVFWYLCYLFQINWLEKEEGRYHSKAKNPNLEISSTQTHLFFSFGKTILKTEYSASSVTCICYIFLWDPDLNRFLKGYDSWERGRSGGRAVSGPRLVTASCRHVLVPLVWHDVSDGTAAVQGNPWVPHPLMGSAPPRGRPPWIFWLKCKHCSLLTCF